MGGQKLDGMEAITPWESPVSPVDVGSTDADGDAGADSAAGAGGRSASGDVAAGSVATAGVMVAGCGDGDTSGGARARGACCGMLLELMGSFGTCRDAPAEQTGCGSLGAGANGNGRGALAEGLTTFATHKGGMCSDTGRWSRAAASWRRNEFRGMHCAPR